MKIKKLLLATMLVATVCSVNAQSNSFPTNDNVTILPEYYIKNNRMYYEGYYTSNNGNTRGNIANNLYWSIGDNYWKTSSSTVSDFGLIRFENAGVLGFFTNSSTNAQQTLTNADLESYRRLTIKNDGKIGIGIANPSALFHVNNPISLGSVSGNSVEIARFSGTTTNNSQLRIQLGRFANGSDWNTASLRLQSVTDATNQGYLEFNPTSGSRSSIAIGSSTTEIIRFGINGNVLIGKTSQANTTYKLDVEGGIRANKLVVNTTGADFVFDSSYLLLPLNELESFIQKNHHLPEIETANEMQLNGVDIGNNQTKLLQKTEELTLYLIAQDKQIQSQSTIIAGQSKEIAELKTIMDQQQRNIELLLERTAQFNKQ